MQATICAVMITGKPGREYLARMAVQAFRNQDHQHRHLLIVNDGEPLLTTPEANMTELRPEHGWSLGKLRNYALDNLPAGVDYVMQWDDDDYSHPTRMRRQLTYQAGMPASVLRFVTHCHLQAGTMRVCTPTRRPQYGFPGTIMHAAATSYRYPEIGKGEDTDFIRHWIRNKQLAVVNNTTSPTLYVRFFHGLNTWSERHIMRFPHAGIPLMQDGIRYVSKLRRDYLQKA